MAGRRPIPPEIRKTRGTYRKDRDNPQAPALPAVRPEPLAVLHGVAAEAWDELLGPLARMRVLTEADRAILQLTVEAYADYREARALIAEHGMTYTTVGQSGITIRAHPAVGIMEDAWRRCRLGLVELGLTPSARRHVNAKEPPPESEWARLTGTTSHA